jgi:dTDP-4-dehydrorhamnose 3,5-epimerase-like enzyme
MISTSLLAGKVQKWSLPVFQGSPPPAAAEHLKRLCLPQGELAQFYNAEQGIRYIAFAELRPDCLRGNHFHRVKEEFVYIISGQVSLVVEEIESKSRASGTLESGDLVFIPTLIAHVFRPIQAGQAIEFSTARFDPADVVRVQLL